MSSADELRVEEPRPPLPAVCRWTGWLACLLFFLLLAAGTLLETVWGRPGSWPAPVLCSPSVC